MRVFLPSPEPVLATLLSCFWMLASSSARFWKKSSRFWSFPEDIWLLYRALISSRAALDAFEVSAPAIGDNACRYGGSVDDVLQEVVVIKDVTVAFHAVDEQHVVHFSGLSHQVGFLSGAGFGRVVANDDQLAGEHDAVADMRVEGVELGQGFTGEGNAGFQALVGLHAWVDEAVGSGHGIPQAYFLLPIRSQPPATLPPPLPSVRFCWV
jgi:hypothetical protein